MIQDLRFPIGEFDRNFDVSPEVRSERMSMISELPNRVRSAVAGLDETQLDTPYRPEGWTIRQTVHHIADSHSNALIRFKLTLTEEEPPTIRPYFEDRWAELADCRLNVDVSITMLDAVHRRWEAVLNSMTEEDFQRKFHHPETGVWTLEGALAQYAWHGLHHTAHITHLRTREGWS